MTPMIEHLASALLLANVWLVARRSIWNYPLAILAVSLYAVIFWQSRLYAVFCLQFLFIALNLYGLLNWKTAKQEDGDIRISHLDSRAMVITVLLVLAGTAPVALLLGYGTDAASPWLDGLITILSLAAQYWQAKRKAESWILWIGVNLLSVGLYASQQLWSTAAVNGILLFIAVYGWQSWRRTAKATPA